MLIRPGVCFSQNLPDAFVRLKQRLLGSSFEIPKLQNITAHFEATVYYRQKRPARVNRRISLYKPTCLLALVVGLIAMLASGLRVLLRRGRMLFALRVVAFFRDVLPLSCEIWRRSRDAQLLCYERP